MNKITHQAKISIVLPVRFVKRDWLIQSIESVISQNWDNKELIIVNDDATEDIDDLVNRYQIKKYIKNKENRGLPFSLNRGFEASEGIFHTWTSADNYMLPGMLKTLAEFLQENKIFDIVYARSMVLDTWKNRLYTTNHEDIVLQKSGWKPGSYEVPNLRIYTGTIGACFLYKKEVWEQLKGYDENLHGAEDFDFWVRASMLFKIGIIPSKDPLYVYRIHSRSISAEVPGCFSRMRINILKREINKYPHDKDLKKALLKLRTNIFKDFCFSVIKKFLSRIASLFYKNSLC